MRLLASTARLAALLALLLAGAASAQDSAASDGQDEKILEEHADTRETPPPADIGADDELPPIYSAIGLQKVSTGFSNVDDAINLDATLVGFRIPTIPWFGIELNVSGTVIPGQISQTSTSGGGTTCTLPEQILGTCTPGGGTVTSTSTEDFAIMSYGVYAALRSPGTFFVMGKLGYRYVQTSIDDAVEEYHDNRSGNAWAIGAGYRWRPEAYGEITYTKLTDDIDAIGFSISYSYDRY